MLTNGLCKCMKMKREESRGGLEIFQIGGEGGAYAELQAESIAIRKPDEAIALLGGLQAQAKTQLLGARDPLVAIRRKVDQQRTEARADHFPGGIDRGRL